VNKAVIIPAVKKNVAFYDDLIKKIAGQSLIERVIDKGKEIVEEEHIYVVTDSEEIRLFSQRKGVQHYFEKSLKLRSGVIIESLIDFLSTIADKYQTFILLSPYSPLLQSTEIQKALHIFEESKRKILVPVKKEFSRIFTGNQKTIRGVLDGESEQAILVETQSFQIIHSSLIENGLLRASAYPLTYELDHDLIEIKSYQDWWVCEKLLNRKRIIFRVIGDVEVGAGHIQRALTLAHEITDHEIRFVCEDKSRAAVEKLAGLDYWLGVCRSEEIEDQILALEPDLVVNDILDTSSNYIKRLRANNIATINFEDLGEGATFSNVTINELYDDPVIEGKNILWGQEYFFIREEFNDAQPCSFKDKVDGLLLMFGGTDPSDFTRKILRRVKEDCVGKGIKIYVLTGNGYYFIEELEKEIEQITNVDVEYHHSIGVVSHIMEKVQIAISSNGRTLYELAHMNIPSIVLSHHERENTHKFACEENGHIPIGIYKEGETEEKLMIAFHRLTSNTDYRRKLFDRIQPYRFVENKKKIMSLVNSLLKD
jgi:spore coat polysaccharide biosynthesis predicted glycosyltransferase SpsG/CMP-N-acetylneuraminic acid synthetase